MDAEPPSHANPAPPDTAAGHDTAIGDPPPGWLKHGRRSPLTDPWEPLYARPPEALPSSTDTPAAAGGPVAGEPGTAIGLRIGMAHCNARGFAHGGLICALADNAMGHASVAAARLGAERRGRTPPQGAVTASLAVDFLDSARVGEWLTVQPVVLRHGATLGTAECRIWADDRLVGRGNATFRFV